MLPISVDATNTDDATTDEAYATAVAEKIAINIEGWLPHHVHSPSIRAGSMFIWQRTCIVSHLTDFSGWLTKGALHQRRSTLNPGQI